MLRIVSKIKKKRETVFSGCLKGRAGMQRMGNRVCL